jgi:hypothetical protein
MSTETKNDLRQKIRAALAAGIPVCRKAGLPNPAKQISRKPKRCEIAKSRVATHAFSGRHGCRPPRQARMPDATFESIETA